MKRDPALSKFVIWIKREVIVLYFVKRHPTLSTLWSRGHLPRQSLRKLLRACLIGLRQIIDDYKTLHVKYVIIKNFIISNRGLRQRTTWSFLEARLYWTLPCMCACNLTNQDSAGGENCTLPGVKCMLAGKHGSWVTFLLKIFTKRDM